MKIDCHVHTGLDNSYAGAERIDVGAFLHDLKTACMDGAVILSADPLHITNMNAEERMQDALNFCSANDNLFPFYWVNPLDEDALAQIDRAVTLGFDGFKMICSNYDPGCRESMDVLERIAQYDKPVLFHSGILWDGRPSANYNRPGNFEALLDIPKLRFCLAHISWPWYDECIAVYGKFNNAYASRPGTSCEMFIDVTPGTPKNYREDVWKHLFGNGYELKYNLMFGTDCNTTKYNINWCRDWMSLDDELYAKYVEGDVADFKEHVYCKNILRFMGKSDEKVSKVIPTVGE